MEIQKNKKTITFDIEFYNYVGNDGNHNTIDEKTINHYIESFKAKVNNKNKENEHICLDSDMVYDFINFPIDTNNPYTEGSGYENFVYEFCRNYLFCEKTHMEYVNTLGRFIQTDKFITKKIYHNDMINHIEINKNINENIEKVRLDENRVHRIYGSKIATIRAMEIEKIPTVKEIIKELLSGSVIRNTTNPKHGYVSSINKNSFKRFVDFILDSSMFTLNELIPYTEEYDKGDDKFMSVASSLIYLCFRLDYKEGIDYLIERGVKSEDLNTSSGISWFMEFLISQFLKNWYYVLGGDEEIKKKYPDRYDSDMVEKMNSKLKWINLLSDKFYDVENTFYHNMRSNSLLKDKVHRYRSVYKKVKEKMPFNHISSFLYTNLIPYYVGDQPYEKNIIVDRIMNHIDSKFKEHNVIELNSNHRIIEHIKKYISINWEGKFIVEDNTIGTNYNLDISSIQSGAELRNGEIYIYTNANIRRFTIDNRLNDEGEYKAYLILDSYKSDIKVTSDVEILIELNTFNEDYKAIETILESWLQGEELSEDDINLCYKSTKDELLKQITEQEKALRELKKKAGIDFDDD